MCNDFKASLCLSHTGNNSESNELQRQQIKISID